MTDEGFRKLTQVVLDIAKDHARGRLVSVLEGKKENAGCVLGKIS